MVLVMVAGSAEIAPGFCCWPPGTAEITPGFVGGHQGSRSRSGVRDFPDLLYILAEAVCNADDTSDDGRAGRVRELMRSYRSKFETVCHQFSRVP